MFRYKEYIFTICETGSFTKAAEKLFVSQPSLSATVKRLEEKIGEPIFDRSSSPVSLTEAGKEYVKYAIQIRELERDFEKYVFDYGNLLAGKIRIGGSSFFSSLVLPEIISEFSKENTKIEFEIFEDNTKNLLVKLRENSLDIIVDNTKPDEENISSKAYKSEQLLLAVPKKFTINKRFEKERLTAEEIKANEHLNVRGIDFSKLTDQPFVLLRRENDTGKRAEKLFKKYEATPNVVFYLDQQVTSYNVACAGIGIAFVSDTLVKSIGASPDVYYYKINDRLAVRNIYFLYKKNGYLSSACRKFLETNAGKKEDI
ncbi:MAG: LysR family transcriptional regulator [Clostridia bacterium]|nr:LysR family transcriptional regulator [Clostridia bacterium]